MGSQYLSMAKATDNKSGPRPSCGPARNNINNNRIPPKVHMLRFMRPTTTSKLQNEADSQPRRRGATVSALMRPVLTSGVAASTMFSPDQQVADAGKEVSSTTLSQYKVSQSHKHFASECLPIEVDGVPIALKVYEKFVRPTEFIIGQYILTSRFLGTTADLQLGLMLALPVLVTYIYDRLRDVDGSAEDVVNNSWRTKWVRKHKTSLWLAIAASMGAVAWMLPGYQVSFQVVYVLTLLVSVNYATPWLPGGHSFRTAPCGKTLVNAACNVMAIVVLPLLSLSTNTTVPSLASTVLMIGHIAALKLGISVTNDCKDVPGDVASNTLSIPVLFGIDRSIGFCKAVLIAHGLTMVAIGCPLFLIQTLACYGKLNKITQAREAMPESDGSPTAQAMWAETLRLGDRIELATRSCFLSILDLFGVGFKAKSAVTHELALLLAISIAVMFR